MLLNNIFSIYRKTRFNLTETKAKKIEFKPALYKFALLTVYNIDNELDEFKSTVKQLLRNSFTVIINTPKFPNNPIIKEEVIYLITEPRYMGALCFKDYSKFSFVCGVGKDGKVEARRTSSMRNIPFMENTLTPQYIKTIDIKKNLNNKILFDTNHEASGRGLGDILMSTAIIKKIKKENPQSKLIYTTRPAAEPILRNNPYIDELKAEEYIRNDFIDKLDNYDKHYFLGKMTEDYSVERNRQPRIDSMAELFNIELEDKKPELFLTEKELENEKKFISKDKLNIIVCNESISHRRKLERNLFLKLLDNLKKYNYNIIVVGIKKEYYPEWICNLTGKTNLRELFSIIALSDLVITMDNFVSHIAAAFDKKEIILYTTIPAEWRCIYYPKAIPIQSKAKCSPCWNCMKNPEIKCDEKCIEMFDILEIEKKISDIKNKNKFQIGELFKFFIPKIKEIKSNTKKAILVKMTSGELGDKLVAVGLVSELKRKYPDYKIDAYIYSNRYNSKDGYVRLFDDCTDECFIDLEEINESKYEKVFEISAFGIHDSELWTTENKYIQLSRYQRWAKQLGFTFIGEVNANYIVKEEDWNNKKDMIQFKSRKRPLIGIAPLTSNVAKNWSAGIQPQQKKWQQVIDYLNDQNCDVITLHYKPLEYKNCFNIGNLSPRELGYVVSKLNLLIGCEAGITHFAGILKIPMIVLVGASSPLVLRHYNNVRILHKGNCYSCNRFISLQFANCECGKIEDNPNSECLTQVTVDDVINEIKQFRKDKKLW